MEDPQSLAKPQEQEDLIVGSSSYLKPAIFVGGALAITTVLIRTDQRTFNALHTWRTTNDPIEDVSPIITNLGDGRASIAIFGGFLAYSYLEKDRSAFQAGKIGLESFLLSGIVVQILKHTFGRERPSAATQNGGRWNGSFLLLNQSSGKRGSYAKYDAFPSGHTATAFAAATTLSEIYEDTPWVSYASYTIASGVAISRVTEQTHWLSDCFVGGLIGYVSTQLVLHYNHSTKPVALLPSYDGQHMRLALTVGL
jgi:membrane-associated phospholipid phosphatase